MVINLRPLSCRAEQFYPFPLSQSLALHHEKRGLLAGKKGGSEAEQGGSFPEKGGSAGKKVALFAPMGRPRMWQRRLNVKRLRVGDQSSAMGAKRELRL